ncbi:MAG: ATP-dependent DNA helicase RecG [Candidatus Liptonbacteria bacterium]|nr:ATP-dependent DNA helicase RecG [Candidatus Liptonbacteria bacterium]
MLKLQTLLSEINGIAPRFLRNFAKLNILTVKDLLWHFPFRYEDFSEIIPIAELEPGRHGTIQGVIQSIKIRRSFRRRFVIVEAIIRDESGDIKATWFNQPYLLNVLRPGRWANFSGKITLSEDNLALSHPIYELIPARNHADYTQNYAENSISQNSASVSVKSPPCLLRRSSFGYEGRAPSFGRAGASVSETRHTARLVPIYPETRGLTSKGIRFLVQPILKNLEPPTDWLPKEVLATAGIPDINRALAAVHFPDTIDAALLAKKRFAFEELFLLQILNTQQKLKLALEKAPAIRTDIEKLKEILKGLPFTLTPSQKKSLWEIIQDIEKPMPMNRLLQGDVGSGKTVIAALAALLASQNGFQSVFMAPTEILARQHFETLKKLFHGISAADQPAVGILTSSFAEVLYENDLEAKISKTDFKKKAGAGEIKIIVGTHALIQKDATFNSLALVVIDEQHRFGVKQRAELLKNRSLIPHLLSMSATPIPRTLMLTVFGDLDISTITELPLGRKPITTKIVAPENRHKAYQFIREQIKKGRQAFVICPRINGDTLINADDKRIYADDDIRINQLNRHKSAVPWETKAVKEEYEKLSRKIFPDLRVAMLHGRMRSKEKEKIMSSFAAGKSDILVSTSVIEVGVDVPNASIMMIEGSERFGLAQLYQLRGRVGRGGHQSFCFLFTDSDSKATSERLKAILEAKNGFELAEKDLKLRGPGEFIGQKQTGLPDIAMRGLQDIELIKQSRAAALKVIQNGGNLKKYPLLIERLDEFKQKIHPE